YTAFFDPDFSIRMTKVAAEAPSHWFHFDAKYRLERQLSETVFEEPPDGEPDAGAADYEAEVARVHKLEDLFKMHTYRDGILGTRGAYVLFPGDGVGGVVNLPKPNLFVRNPGAFGGSGTHRIPSVGAFDLAPGGDAAQTQAIASLLAVALEAVAGPSNYEEERGHWVL
ncbi:nuclease domain-containing protein, partial [Ralstonia pickettii]